MTESTRRLWGIDVIAGIYGVATLLLGWLCFNGTGIGRAFGLILAPMFAIICLGISFRVNIIRIGLIALLSIALIGDGILLLYFLGALAGVVQSPANKEPLDELVRMPLRIGATLTMFLYAPDSAGYSAAG